MYRKSAWAFDETVAPVFDAHVRQSIPAYEWIQESVVHMTDFFFSQKAVVVDLGSGTGETLTKIASRHKMKELSLIGVDQSREMICEAVRKGGGSSVYQWVPDKLQDYVFPAKVDVVISILTLQFLEPEERQEVINRAYSSLKKGGALFFVEKVLSDSGRIQDVFTQVYHDQKESAGLSPDEIRRKDESIRGVMRPFTIQENEEMLKEAGFTQIELFMKHFQFTGFLAVK